MKPQVFYMQQSGPSRFYCAAENCTMYPIRDEDAFCLYHDAQIPTPTIKNGLTLTDWLRIKRDVRASERQRGWEAPVPTPVKTSVSEMARQIEEASKTSQSEPYRDYLQDIKRRHEHEVKADSAMRTALKNAEAERASLVAKVAAQARIIAEQAGTIKEATVYLDTIMKAAREFLQSR